MMKSDNYALVTLSIVLARQQEILLNSGNMWTEVE